MSEVDLIIVALVSLGGSFVKAVTGMGFPLIAIPALTLIIGVESAVVVIALPNVIANALLNWGVREERKKTRDLPVLVTTSIVGAVIGTLVLVEAPEGPLLIGLAMTVLAFVIQRLRQPHLTLSPSVTRRGSPFVGIAAGFSQGAVGVSGPIVALWFHGYRLGTGPYVFSITALFLVAGVTQLSMLIAAGAYTRERLIASAVALIATLSVIPLGTRVRARLASETFERLILLLLVLSGLSLIWRALG